MLLMASSAKAGRGINVSTMYSVDLCKVCTGANWPKAGNAGTLVLRY